jgi:DNA-directed RNA polymerase specialized sigma24 family protein
MKPDNHYVNNKEMLECIIEYNQKLKHAIDTNSTVPRIPEYFGECILKIATHLFHRPNFINYTYKDDMISDGIENALSCIKSFDTEKYSNPFSYFTQVIYFAFLRRISKEQRHRELKIKVLQNVDYETYALDIQDADDEHKNAFIEFLREHQPTESMNIVEEKVLVKKPLDEFFL